MSTNLVKIPSQQGTFDTLGAKQLVDFHIPESVANTINLDESYINVNCTANVNLNVDALEVFNSRLKFAGGANAANHYPSNIVLVKNAQLSSMLS